MRLKGDKVSVESSFRENCAAVGSYGLLALFGLIRDSTPGYIPQPASGKPERFRDSTLFASNFRHLQTSPVAKLHPTIAAQVCTYRLHHDSFSELLGQGHDCASYSALPLLRFSCNSISRVWRIPGPVLRSCGSYMPGAHTILRSHRTD